jgi:Holliday junction resolvase
MKSPESFEKDEIKAFLTTRHVWFFLPYMAGFGKSGVPDIVACWRGRFVSIEVKREGKAPTKLQEARMREIVQAGGIAVAGTAAMVIAALERIGM